MDVRSRESEPCEPVNPPRCTWSVGIFSGSQTLAEARAISKFQPLPVDIPEKFVVVLEEAQLACGQIRNGVGMIARAGQGIADLPR